MSSERYWIFSDTKCDCLSSLPWPLNQTGSKIVVFFLLCSNTDPFELLVSLLLQIKYLRTWCNDDVICRVEWVSCQNTFHQTREEAGPLFFRIQSSCQSFSSGSFLKPFLKHFQGSLIDDFIPSCLRKTCTIDILVPVLTLTFFIWRTTKQSCCCCCFMKVVWYLRQDLF